jgi:hypothetical protein
MPGCARGVTGVGIGRLRAAVELAERCSTIDVRPDTANIVKVDVEIGTTRLVFCAVIERCTVAED